MDLSMALVGEKDRDGRMKILYPNRDIPRTKYIWWGECKYHRTAQYHGSKIYIIQFLGDTRMEIEYLSGEQYIVDVDDEKFILTESEK